MSVVEQLEEGTITPLMEVLLKRDAKPGTVGELGIIVTPETSYTVPDWCTVVAVPRLVEVNKERVEPKISRGDRVFVRPGDGWKFLDMQKDYQSCFYTQIEAVEKDGEILPFYGRVLVKMETQEKNQEKVSGWFGEIDLTSIKSESGLFLPETVELTGSTDDTGRGTITAVGEGIKEPLPAGSFIYYLKDNSPKIRINNEDYVIVREEDILMVVDE